LIPQVLVLYLLNCIQPWEDNKVYEENKKGLEIKGEAFLAILQV